MKCTIKTYHGTLSVEELEQEHGEDKINVTIDQATVDDGNMVLSLNVPKSEFRKLIRLVN